MPDFLTSGHALWASVLAIGLTAVVYLATRAVYRKSGFAPVLIPVLTGSALIIAVLMLSGTPYPVYYDATGPLRLVLGPAIVALAVPLYGQLPRLKKMWLPLCVAVLAEKAPCAQACGAFSLAGLCNRDSTVAHAVASGGSWRLRAAPRLHCKPAG